MNTKLPLNLDDLLRQRTVEGERIEYKAGRNPDPIIRTLRAFANDFEKLGGGYVVIGQACDESGLPIFPPVGPTCWRSRGERLLERGLIEARGEKRARIYHLAASLYNRLQDVSGYVRTRGFDKIQQRQMVLAAVAARKDKRITREDVVELCKITPAQAYHLLKKKTADNDLELHGAGRGSYYTLNRTDKHT
jgi:hypothetical protein